MKIVPLLGCVLILVSCHKATEQARQIEKSATKQLPKYKVAPTFSGVDQESRSFTTKQLQGKTWIASFFFAQCQGPCPVLNSRLSVLNRTLGEFKNLRFVSVTVDPENDTPEVLKETSIRYGANKDRWFFVRTKTDEVADLSSKGFVVGNANKPVEHSTRFILVDRDGMIRGFYDGLDSSKVMELESAVAQLEGNR